ncbi:aldehyde dehydrogenase family protein [Bradyrhizobium sp. CCBAU 53338]|uniref:aldehyde dehydrogenase family protein n=1 Tax=Bradyrhizobium sp. CCBAU 53338 TaxID=1325111 RepID=UPI00352DEE92
MSSVSPFSSKCCLLALEAGLPAGVFNVVAWPGRVVADALVNHLDFDKVTFTGSPGVGRGMMKGAAGKFKRVSLEVGGKSAKRYLRRCQSRSSFESRGLPDLLQRRPDMLGRLLRVGAGEGL